MNEVTERVDTQEQVEVSQEEVQQDAPKENNDLRRFDLDDKQAEILRQHASALNSYYTGIGAQFCELMESVKQVEVIRKNITQLQEDIAKELNIPRADRVNWNLDEKFVEIVK